MSKSQKHSWGVRLAITLFILGSGWWGIYLASPPSPKPATATTEFSAERAFRDVQQMAEKPHMVGTAEHDSVKQYLLGRLEQLGLEPHIEEGISTARRGNSIRAVQVQNIIARMEGNNSQKTILLMAHYDSVPYAPGAADDAAGVAAILETVRALQAGTPLQNDVIILFTDAEEGGLMGARYFTENNPLMEEIDLVLNFEARGTSGSSIMFETNDGNDKLIPLFEEATPSPVANSLTYSVYKVLPNDTDFTMFKQHDIQGLNYAFIEDYLDYHTMQDNPENLSLSSLQHHGENLLGNMRLFGNTNFDISAQSDVIYFNNPFGGITYYPQSWSYYIMGFTLLFFIYFLVSSYQKNRVSLLRTGVSFLGFSLLLLISALVTWYSWTFIEGTVFPQYQWLVHGETYARSWYLWLFLLFATLIATGLLRWIDSYINTNNLLGGIYLTWFTLVIALTVLLPAANYFLLWPAFFGLLGWAFAADSLKEDPVDYFSIILLSLSLFTVLFMFPFYIKLIQVALTTQMLSVSVVLFLLMFGLLWPLVDLIIADSTGAFYGVISVVMIYCAIGAVLNSDYTAEAKKQNSLIYAADQDNKNAYWISTDRKTDSWTSSFLGGSPVDSSFSGLAILNSGQHLYSKAPFLEIASPQIDSIQNQSFDSLRQFTFQVRPTYSTHATNISFPNPNQIRELIIDGKIIYSGIQPSASQTDSLLHLNYYKEYMEPFEISVTTTQGESPIRIKLVSYNLSYPDSLMMDYPLRPDHSMPKPSGFTNGTIWKTTVSLDSLVTVSNQQNSE